MKNANFFPEFQNWITNQSLSDKPVAKSPEILNVFGQEKCFILKLIFK